MEAIVEGLQLCVVDDHWLRKFTIDVLLYAEKELLDLLGHCSELVVILAAKGVLNSSQFLLGYDNIFLV